MKETTVLCIFYSCLAAMGVLALVVLTQPKPQLPPDYICEKMQGPDSLSSGVIISPMASSSMMALTATPMIANQDSFICRGYPK